MVYKCRIICMIVFLSHIMSHMYIHSWHIVCQIRAWAAVCFGRHSIVMGRSIVSYRSDSTDPPRLYLHKCVCSFPTHTMPSWSLSDWRAPRTHVVDNRTTTCMCYHTVMSTHTNCTYTNHTCHTCGVLGIRCNLHALPLAGTVTTWCPISDLYCRSSTGSAFKIHMLLTSAGGSGICMSIPMVGTSAAWSHSYMHPSWRCESMCVS
jgi:hypothetical protein